MQKLFMCHYTNEDAEVTALAEEMHLRGVPLWLDHEGGFGAGDNTHTEARRVISDPAETFGLLMYATPEAFNRDFIQRIELDEAIRRKDRDDTYLLMAVPRRMGFMDMSRLSLSKLGEDLTKFHSHPIRDTDAEGVQPLPLRPQFAEIANMVLDNRLIAFDNKRNQDDVVGINYCTRDHLVPSDDDVLDIDATSLLKKDQSSNGWLRLQIALLDVKKHLRKTIAAPRLRIRGSKHLTAAFLIGRIFPPSTVREILTQQGIDMWSSTCQPSAANSFDVKVVDGAANSTSLFVEITTDRNVRESVRQFIASSSKTPFVSLRFEPGQALQGGIRIDNAIACQMALQVRSEVNNILATRSIKEIHIFAAIPQGLATMIGHHLNAIVPIQLYEHDGQHYHPSAYLEHKILT